MKESITATIHPTYGWTYLKISDVELSDGIVSFNYNYMGVLFPMGGSTIFATSRDSSSTGIEFNEQPLQVQQEFLCH